MARLSPYVTQVLALIHDMPGRIPFFTQEQLGLASLTILGEAPSHRNPSKQTIAKAREKGAKIRSELDTASTGGYWHCYPYPYPFHSPFDLRPKFDQAPDCAHLPSDERLGDLSRSLFDCWYNTPNTIRDREGNNWLASEWVSSFRNNDSRCWYFTYPEHEIYLPKYTFSNKPVERNVLFLSEDENGVYAVNGETLVNANGGKAITISQGESSATKGTLDVTWFRVNPPEFPKAVPEIRSHDFPVYADKRSDLTPIERTNPSIVAPPGRAYQSFHADDSKSAVRTVANEINEAYLSFCLNVELANCYLDYYVGQVDKTKTAEARQQSLLDWASFQWQPLMPYIQFGVPLHQFTVGDGTPFRRAYSFGYQSPAALKWWCYGAQKSHYRAICV